ncbi:YncE family protein [Pseudomonas sp.]|uniref:YncE family protein n=1 Tax=Pseudomonas sp. TaxID=306 RepID=UPI003C35A07E
MSTLPIDMLDSPPQPAFRAVPLAGTLYPERAAFGMGTRHLLPNFEAYLERWFNCNVGDFYSLFVGNMNTPLISAYVSDQRNRYSWTTPGTNVPQGEVPMFARVIRAGSGQESISAIETYLIKTALPGGFDPVAGNIWHDGLSMSIDGMPRGSIINATVAASGMTALINKYANIRANDEIEISVGGPLVYHTVSPAEAAGPGPIRVPIPRSIFSQINQSGDVAINFTVTDVVKNVSGPGGIKALYSPPYILKSELDPSLLGNPVFYADNAEAPVVDLDTQSQSVFTVLIPTVRTPTLPSPNRLVVILTITRPDGSVEIVRLPPVNDLNRFSEIVTVPNALITPLAGGSFQVSFELQNASGVRLRQSGSYSVQVVGTPVTPPVYPPMNTLQVRPLINAVPNNGSLDLNAFAGNGQLSMERWPSSAAGQRVWITASGAGVPDLVLLSGVAINANEALNGLSNIPVPRTWLRQVKSGNITLSGAITLNGSTDRATAVAFASTTYSIRWELGIIESIMVGAQPHWIVITRDGRTAYLTNHGSHTVSVIDIAQRKVVNTIGGFNRPFRIAMHPDESRLYVGNLGSKTISVINLDNNALIQTIPSFQYIWGLCLNRAGTRLFVSSSIDNLVGTYDAMTGTLLSTTYVTNPFGCALNHLESRFYVAGPSQVNLLNPSGASGLIGAIPGINTQPVGSDIAFNPFDMPRERAYVTGTNAVYIINPPTNTIAKTLPGFTYAYGVAMSPRVRECYVTDNGNTFTVINTDTETVVRRHSGFANPAGVAVTPDGSVALVANQANGTLSFVAL